MVDARASVLPGWFRQRIPDMEKTREMKSFLRSLDLDTVCESAFCPNAGQCWGRGVATLMILGDLCTRACRFCAVKTGRPLDVDLQEPLRVAQAVAKLRLRYAVVTSVTRDDLADAGSGQFVRTIEQIRLLTPQTKIEVLIPDFSNRIENLRRVVDAAPDVISHNIETVRRLSGSVRPQADYGRSLCVLRNLKEMNPNLLVKSGLMIGLGETDDEIAETMKHLAEAGCDMLTIGQYLSPTKTKRHARVERFVTPEEFAAYQHLGLRIGFKHVMSGPLVRSSYIAEEGYRQCVDKMVIGKGNLNNGEYR